MLRLLVLFCVFIYVSSRQVFPDVEIVVLEYLYVGTPYFELYQ